MRRTLSAWAHVRPYAVPAAVFLVLCLAMFWRLWTPIDGAQRAFGWDAQWEYWGDLQFQLDAYADGDLPLWNPYDRTGYPFHADIQAGILYPVTWLLLLVGALAGGAAWWLIAVKIVLHFWLAGIGTYTFLRRRDNPALSCYAGGVLVLFSYPMLHNVFSALNWSFAWAPWVLVAIDAWAPKPRLHRAALVALALAMSALAGGMAAFWYGLLIAVPYGTWAIVHAARDAEDPRAYLRAAAITTGAALALFLCLVGAQFAATADLVGESVRAKRDVAFFGVTVIRAHDMIGLFVPKMQGENTYLGFAAILWAGSLLTLRPTARTLVLAGVFALGVLCAWGQRGMFLALFASIVPPFGFFRRAHRYLYVAALAFAILAAEGLTLLQRLDDDARLRVRRWLVAAGGVAVLACTIGFAIKVAGRAGHGNPLRDAFGLGAIAALVGTWLTVMVLDRRRRVAAAFAVIAVVGLGIDLWFCRAHVIDRNMHAVPRTPRDADAVALPDVPLASRIYDLEYLKFRPGLRNQIRDFGGYEDDPLSLRRYAGYLQAIRGAPRHLGHLNVAHFFEEGRKVLRKSAADKAALKAVRRGAWRVGPVAPAVMWTDTASIVEGGHAEAQKRLLMTSPGTTTVLEGGSLTPAQRQRAAEGDRAAPSVAGELVELERNRLVATIDAPADGVVVIHEAYVPFGWSARVNGEPAAIVPANGLFRGVFVGPGRHTIEMEYRAPRFLALAGLQLIALVGIATLLVVAYRRQRAPAA